MTTLEDKIEAAAAEIHAAIADKSDDRCHADKAAEIMKQHLIAPPLPKPDVPGWWMDRGGVLINWSQHELPTCPSKFPPYRRVYLPAPPMPRTDAERLADVRKAIDDVDSADERLVQVQHIKQEFDRLIDENERLRQKLLTAAGDDLCRLTQEEIEELSSGAVKIPPKEEFLASCERFHSQMANENGVMEGCLTLAQLVAENERLRATLDSIAEFIMPDAVVGTEDDWTMLRTLIEEYRTAPAAQPPRGGDDTSGEGG